MFKNALDKYNYTSYSVIVIRGFKDKATEDIFDGTNSLKARSVPNTIWKAAQRKMALINNAGALNDLAALPGNQLERLSGKWNGFHSIRVNDQYRMVFRWENGQADEVQIVDYHD
ncbi:MAG: type II toxin-antitoxin system RelE/ParE family toxin [Elusimicrobiota bacterium]